MGPLQEFWLKCAPSNFCDLNQPDLRTFVTNSALSRLRAFWGALFAKIWWQGALKHLNGLQGPSTKMFRCNWIFLQNKHYIFTFTFLLCVQPIKVLFCDKKWLKWSFIRLGYVWSLYYVFLSPLLCQFSPQIMSLWFCLLREEEKVQTNKSRSLFNIYNIYSSHFL